MPELHVAVTLDQPEVVASILSQNLCNIHEIDDNGDQPSHIAARLNHIECMKVLIEHDARMGRKNFCGLTPLGEAQMGGNKDIAALIKINYTTNVPEEYIWHDEVSRETAAWYDTWDDEQQKLQWTRLGPNGSVEVSATPPPIDIQRVIQAREMFNERKVVRRIHPKSLLSMRQLEYQTKRQMEQEKLKTLLKDRARLVEERCAIKLQAHWRKLKATLRAGQRLRERVAATRIQRRFKYFIGCKKTSSAIRIQSFIRTAISVSYYKSYHQERMWWYRASRKLACHVQNLWRGFKARSRYRHLYEMNSLPDPTDMLNFDFWERCQYEARPPKRELGIYAEYTLSGNPRSWEERGKKRGGVFHRDVSFYANTITKRATWSKPKGWLFKDQREYYVLRVQTFWRARVARRKIRLFTKAKLLLENAHSQDLENTKQDIASLCNYTLYVHAVLHDYDRARDLYTKMMDFMNHRGVDNAFVLYSYAIFGAVTNEEDWDEIKDYARRAEIADKRMQKRRTGPVAGREPAKSSYQIATASFYLQSVCSDHDPAESWHNYAICQMLVHHDLDSARESFTQAMIRSPQDNRIISNFNTLLQDHDFLGDPNRNAHEEFLQSRKNENT